MRNGVIDFLKFFFSIIILCFHNRNRYFGGGYFKTGYLAVDFFFIVTGIMLAASAQKEKTPVNEIGTSTIKFMKRKISALLPNYYIAWLITFFVTEMISQKGIRDIIVDAINSLGELTFLKHAGIPGVYSNGPAWYISAMLIVVFLLYPLIKRCNKLFFNIIAPIIVVVIYGWLGRNFVGFADERFGDWNENLFRAIMDISLGTICYAIAQYIKKIDWTIVSTYVFSAIEVVLYMVTIWYMVFKTTSRFDYLIIIMFAMALVFTYSQVGKKVQLFEANVFTYLSEFGFNLYLGHWCIGKLMSVSGLKGRMRNIGYTMGSIAVALLIMYISRGIKKVWNKNKKRIKGFFVKDNTYCDGNEKKTVEVSDNTKENIICEKNQEGKRASNLELLRIICMVGILSLHFISNSSIANYNTLSDAAFFVGLGSFGRVPCSIFVMLGAWFLIDADFKFERILKLWLTAFMYSVPLTLVCKYLLNVEVVYEEMFRVFFPISRASHWFVSLYIILLMEAPLLNYIVKSCPRKKLLGILCICGIVMFGFSTLTCRDGALGNNFTWFPYLYLVTGYLKKYTPKILFNQKFNLCLGLGTYIVLCILKTICVLPGHDYEMLSKYVLWYLSRFWTLPNFLCAIGVFFFFLNLKIKYNKWINIVASTTFGVYVIHGVPMFQSYLWENIFRASEYRTSDMNLMYTFFVIVTTFVVCMIIELIRNKWIMPWVMKPFALLCKKVNAYINE